MKKGFELKALLGIALTFVIVAIILSFGSTITNEIQEDITETGSVSRVNVTGSDTSLISTETEEFEAGRRDCSINGMIVTNATTVAIPYDSANYSISACILTWIGDSDNNATLLNYSYLDLKA